MPSANGGGKMEQSKKKQAKRAEIWKKQLGVENSDDFRRTMGPALAEAGDRHDNNVPTKKRKESEKKEKVMDNSSQSNFPEDNADVYKDSSTFLKGTQSMNPHNDYCQNYVDTGERPQNFIRDVGLTERFGEYPKLKDLIRLKDEVIRKSNTPPTYLKADLRSFNLRTMGSKFDVILIEPPLEEYKKVAGLPITKQEYNWEEIGNLDIPSVCGPRSFIFLWCGSSDGLDHGRRCLKRWGYRRCEDICWIKTNLKQKKASVFEDSIFVRTKEHCLMGIKGTVRRSLDGDFIHANVDIDLIIAEECEPGSDEKPEEIFHIIEHFCLGRRRLHLFGKDLSIRPGWLTVGPQLTTSNFDKLKYSSNFEKAENNTEPLLSGSTDEIERLRPKTPPPREKKQDRNSLTSGRGGGMQSGGRGGGMQSGGRGGGMQSGGRGGGMQSGGVGRNNRMGGVQNNNGRTQASPQNQQQQKDVNNQSSNHQMMGAGGRRTATDHRQAVPANGGGAVGFHERGGSVDARGPRNRNGSWDSRTSGSRPRTMGGYKGSPHQGNTPEFRS